MLIDEVTIKISGGKGGDGCVAFDKSKGGRGPTGATGGKGGNVYIEATDDLSALNRFRFKKDFFAEDGENGKNRLLDGKTGEDMILKVPVGTIAYNLDNKKTFEILNKKDKILLAKGGKGGHGNWFFRSSTNTTPKEFEKGTLGETFNIKLELRFIAQIGLIGLPSAGKSSLLNSLTKSNAKVAAYPFTTLEPNLGDFFGMIIADIPGLIEGASEGKGLGIKFLRHIQRTNILIHCISSESQDIKKDYETIRKELEKYAEDLIQKKEYIFITKTDLSNEKDLEKKRKELQHLGKEIYTVSITNKESIEKLRDIFSEIKKDIDNQ